MRITQGDLLKSSMHGLVNTVNTAGAMGKGIAAAFKKRYPEMYEDYVRRCHAGEVHLGQPYPFDVGDHVVINFPTKGHWRSVSKLDDIVAGLEYMRANYQRWGLKSLAVPPLGCGNGQLEWSVVGPTLVQHLAKFDIPVELYAPFGTNIGGPEQLNLWDSAENTERPIQFVDSWQVALVEILSRLERQPYRWPVGRVMFQKIAYFANAAGVPTDLAYERASHGPFAPQLKPTVAKLQNNGLINERQLGKTIEVRVGSTFESARQEYRVDLEKWEQAIDSTCDLMARFDTTQAEIAATIHYTTDFLTRKYGASPTASQVIHAVEAWKVRRRPPLRREDIIQSIVNLATLEWISVVPDASIEQALMEFSPA
ncbi:macro domain-containing protein [Streptomyces sp. NPDC000151]|uniref:type II toxin-antitoxin system antitoxin DNA ADP-ribosyl glycohydrolase DarG n=1 Tax=Streptomyces sp. NPDC000151 TaxID=3154244 RepID=UPI0033288184